MRRALNRAWDGLSESDGSSRLDSGLDGFGSRRTLEGSIPTAHDLVIMTELRTHLYTEFISNGV
jgi:hypothetical protein